ncbi:GNAT family N-acetyltransferase [Streptacidiphilus sp. MAP5-52]|uniref:GNAT family N-acetyltransferase n=1 Tax=Streptacidiphilus sp. MAP5-52 TaxID=3156267 RepID=UPI003511048E
MTDSTTAVRWFGRASDLPPVRGALPWHSNQFAAAWEAASPEHILARHYLHLDDPSQTVAFNLVTSSPFFDRLLHDAQSQLAWPAPVLVAGTLYAEYGGAGGANAHSAATTLRHGRILARDLGASALVIPNLSPAQLDLWQQARQADAAVFTDLSFTSPVDDTGLRGFADSITNRHTARDMLRQHRRGTEAGLRLVPLRGTEMLAALPAFTRLVTETADKHGTALYNPRMFAPLAQVPGAILLAAVHDNTLVGGFLSFVHKDRLSLWTAGIDLTRQRDLHTYTWLVCESVAYACDQGLRVLDAGRSNSRYKRRHGLTGQPLHSLVHTTGHHPDLVAGLNDLGNRLARYAEQGSPVADGSSLR